MNAYAQTRLLRFGVEWVALWFVLGVVSLAGVVFIQPHTWGTRATNAYYNPAALEAWRQDMMADYDLSSLPRYTNVTRPSFYQPQVQYDFNTAVAAAEVIVVGSVVKMEPFDGYTVISVAVDEYLKGDAPATAMLQYFSRGTVHPTSNALVAGKGTIVDYDFEPYLLPGERTVLFLDYTTGGFTLQPEPWVGIYRVFFGRIETSAGNPLSESVDGLKLGNFVDQIRHTIVSQETHR